MTDTAEGPMGYTTACPECDSSVGRGHNYCHQCGERLPDDSASETAIEKRCNCCGWTGTEDDAINGVLCPVCQHGLTDYQMEIHTDDNE